jgi:uncharacterized protein (DUF1501 family)
MTYSEFGRRIRSNSSYGCDHGTSAPLILFGNKLKGGLIGTNPEISDSVGENDNLPFQTDFRSVYATILKDWFGSPVAELKTAMPGAYSTIDLFRA